MPYVKVYNPDDKDMILSVGSLTINLPSKKIVIIEGSEEDGSIIALKNTAPALEVAPATEEEFKISIKSLKPTKPSKLGGTKKGKKGH